MSKKKSKKQGIVRDNLRRMTHPEEMTDAEAQRAPRILAFALAGLAVVALLTWGARVLFFEPETTQAKPSPTTVQSTPRPSTTPEPADAEDNGSACDLGSNSSDVSATPPPAAKWVVIGDVRVPEVAGAGPCRTVGGVELGFQRSMTGALVAAYNFAAIGGNSASSTQARAFIDHAVVPGPMQTEMRKHLDAVLSGAAAESAVASKEFEVRGYQVVSYTKDTALISLLFTRISDQRSVSVLEKLVWHDGDWKVDAAGPSSWASTEVDPPEAPFTLWGSSEQ